MLVHRDESTNNHFAISNAHIPKLFFTFLADTFKTHHDPFASRKKRVSMKKILNLDMLSFQPQKVE